MNPASPRRILVTSALPYANGPLHLGHMLENIQTDIWVRYQRLAGNDCQWIWASDAHGTPIMLKARAEGIEPEALITRMKAEHERDIAGFLLSPDNFHTTHSDENREIVELIYSRLRDAGQIVKRTIKQLYDAKKSMFLPDRFVKGTCPNCGAADQYGDNCEVCSATYDATELEDPVSQVSGTTPELRDSEQYFFALGNHAEMLRTWITSGAVQPEVANKMKEWLDAGLQDWDISRNAPYFGFEIPDAPGKYFYVWLDAPIAYIASHKHLAARTGEDWESAWTPATDAELYHFIGKDITNFHCLFWPAMLESAGFRKPTGVFAHGFLTVDGAKMSKSRGTAANAETWLRHLEPEYLRYYFAAKLGSGVVDINMAFDDFVTRVNSDLIGKVVNIASRCASFINRQFAGELAAALSADAQARRERFVAAQESILAAYEAREFGRAMREIMALAEEANVWINDAEPWVLAKDPARADEVQAICTAGLDYFRIIMTYLSPVLPALAEKSADFLDAPLTLEGIAEPLLAHAVKPYKPLMTRVNPADIEKVLAETRAQAEAAEKAAQSATGAAVTGATGGGASDGNAAGGAAASPEPLKPEIEFADFDRIDLRIATIVDAQPVEGADKLLELTLDIGIETRKVFAGIKAAYDPADMIGRQTVMVANLKPRKMRFGVSEGMVLAAGPGGSELFILSPDEGATAGMRAK